MSYADYKKVLDEVLAQKSASSGFASSVVPSIAKSSITSSNNIPVYRQTAAQRAVLDPIGTSRARVSSRISGRTTVGKKKDEDDKKVDFFKKGAFDDGYQMWDITKTILGTAGDAGLNLVKGAGSLVEGVGDLISYGAAGAADALDEDEWADHVRKRAQENRIEEWTQGLTDYFDKNSVLAKTSDSILQGLGQVGGIMATGGIGAAAGLSGAGVTALTTGVMGLSGMGSGMGEAYQSGATDEEAATYGLISGAADALTELVFGGLGKSVNALGFSKGLSSADDMIAKAVSDKFKNQIVKNVSQFGVKAGAEGLEEVMAGFLQAAGKKATYMSEKDFKDILEDENLMEQFIVGSLTSGVIQSGLVPGTKKGSLVEANKTGSDFLTGLSKNEMAVVKKEVENRIAEIEKNGEKLTAKQKSNLEAEVIRDMEKGYISTDTIEEALGGDTYANYKQVADWEDSLLNEFNTLRDEFTTLNKMKNGDRTGEQDDRRAELRKILEEKDKHMESVFSTSGRYQLKEQLGNEVREMIKGDRLVESYNERVRRGQTFTADLNKYDEKQRTIVQKAIDSGVLNNTNRTHDLVDLVAKIGADKNITFDFTNNEKLKGSPFAVEGKTVNGYVTKDGVTINVDSRQYLPTVVGHEIAHVLEGTEVYAELQKTLFDFAESKGELGKRFSSTKELYKNIKDADVKAEMTADLIGEYLFTDGDFVKSLSTQNRNIFQKIYDEIKYLCKVATAGSKEAKELERVKKLFADAYRENVKPQAKEKATEVTEETKETKVYGNTYVDAQNNVTYDDAGNAVTTQYSISDSNGRQLTTEQQEFFKDSVVRDDNGNLKVMYHGTSNGGFNTFDTYGSNYGLFGTGSYFTDSKTIAESYTNKGRGSIKQVYETYLNIKNPMDMDAEADADVWAKAFPDATFPSSGTNEDFYRAVEEYFADEEYAKWEAAEIAVGAIQEMGYDGITHIGGGRVNADGERHQVYIAFEPEQIKNFDNAKPTDNPDIRYSLAEETNAKLSNVGFQYDAKSETVSYSLSSLEDAFSYNKGNEEYRNAREEYVSALARSIAVDKDNITAEETEKASKYLDSLFLIHDMIAMDRDRLDYEAAPKKSAWVSNVEYGGSIDFSTLCAKRRLFTGTFDAIQNALPDTVLTDKDFLNIRNLLLQNDLESPCSMCYVEGSRAKHGVYVDKWLKEYLKTDPEWKPQIADFTSTTRLEQTRIQHPEAYAAYVKAMNKLSQRKPKEASVRTDYKGEILKAFADDSTVETKNRNGGIRFNSFSDFEIIHALDCMQVITDMARVGLNGQAYTKVKEFAEAFGNTGLKINLSLVAKDVDTNGKLIMDETNGMKYAEAMDIRNRYSDNVGTVIVVFNDRQLMAALADNSIDYVLPFHRSQWKKSQYDLMGLPMTTRDYTNIQNERYKNPKTGKPKKVPTGNIMPNEYWDFTLSGRENAQKYLDYINENSYIPKFDFLLNKVDGKWVLPDDAVGDGYFKLLIDFKMYNNDGVGSPQNPVLPEFNMPYIQEMLDKYVGGHQAFPVAHNVVDEFVEGKKNGMYSLSEDDFAPTKMYGDMAIRGEDVRFDSALAPIQEDVAENATSTPTISETETIDDIAPVPEAEQPTTRKALHQKIVDNIRSAFKAKGFDFDEVLKKAKNLSTWSTVDNTPQRVMEKVLGYKEGGILADITVNKVAQNETNGIKWLNSYVAQLKQISKEYGIKPGSKESAAAQMFAEGFYVNENNEIIRYGEPELIQDFGNADVRRRIKGLARDPRIRKIYDDTLAAINESRSRNLYEEIPRLDNYFLHFRAMEDTFSTLGLPFNPNDIRAKDLPTDLNGVTADLKPGQPYFSSAMHRTGKRTSFDLLGGVERYLNSAKNQIYHIDDIQTLRALRNYIAETYGQATGLEDIDLLTDAEAEERIKQVYGSHLSTFAKFLNEEANVLAGKTALIDRGVEGIIGRRGITFLNTLNGQVGSNMVGYNISSSLTNFLPVAQTFAKTNKFDFTKAFVQTVAHKLTGGKFDTFAEDSPVVIRRKGSDRFYQTPWQKMQNPGYALMGIVDDISTEIIARTKYNEFTRKGMDSQKAHFETDKWVSKLMGDRSLGQQPHLYNSKMLGLLTKFQLEVRNQLDAQFYDTIQETKVSNEHIQNGLARNAKTAAKVASTFTQLAVAQHLYGMAFESIAGYNPAFDIIEVLMTAFGYDDEEDSEDTALDNLAQGFSALLEDLPYASTFTGGGRIPVSSAIPDVGAILNGEDEYGNEIGVPTAIMENVKDIAPYYLMPGGYGQAKKTYQGLKMFSDDHPIAGSYTEAGNLRFDVEDTAVSRIKAGIFGQYASENAQKYFDQEQRTLNPEQTEIFAGLDIPIEEYWEYRDNLYEFYDVKDQLKEAAYSDDATDEDVLRYTYINNVYGSIYDLYDKQKEIASGNSRNKKSELRDLQAQMEQMLSNSKYAVDNMKLSGAYGEVGDKRYNKDADSGKWYEIKPKNADGSDNWYYQKEQEVTKGLGISYEDYWNNREEYNYAYDKPGKYAIAQSVGGYDSYMDYYDALENWQSDNYISADKDSKGNSISGSRKKKVLEYINGLDLDYGERIILYRTVYSSKADKRAYNGDIIDYLNSRDDISYKQMEAILKELDFEVDSKGNITW